MTSKMGTAEKAAIIGGMFAISALILGHIIDYVRDAELEKLKADRRNLEQLQPEYKAVQEQVSLLETEVHELNASLEQSEEEKVALTASKRELEKLLQAEAARINYEESTVADAERALSDADKLESEIDRLKNIIEQQDMIIARRSERIELLEAVYLDGNYEPELKDFSLTIAYSEKRADDAESISETLRGEFKLIALESTYINESGRIDVCRDMDVQFGKDLAALLQSKGIQDFDDPTYDQGQCYKEREFTIYLGS